MEPPRIDGYAVETLIGFGPTGQLWRAKAEPSGLPVALKLLRSSPALPAADLADRLRAEAASINALESRHLVPVREIRVDAEQVVVVTDYVAGDSLDTLLSRRDRLTPGEVITLIAPLAQTVADLHLAGLVHGNLTPSNVLLAPDGRPLLTDIGIAIAMGTTTALPADDVRALAALGLTACAGSGESEPLVRVLKEVAGSTPERRPSARDLATAVLDAGQAVPIRTLASPRPSDHDQRSALAAGGLVTGRPEPAPRISAPARRLPVDRPEPVQLRPGEQRMTLRRVVLVGATAGAVLIGAAAAYAHVRGSTPTATTPSAATPTPTTLTPSPTRSRQPVSQASAPNWQEVAQQLDAARARAFVKANADLLKAVYAPTANGLPADEATIRRLDREGLRAVGFTATVSKAVAIKTTDRTATLRVTDQLSAYQLLSSDGPVEAHGEARPARSYLMRLTKTKEGWRVQSIESSAASSFG